MTRLLASLRGDPIVDLFLSLTLREKVGAILAAVGIVAYVWAGVVFVVLAFGGAR